jgi:hypothetical protein
VSINPSIRSAIDQIPNSSWVGVPLKPWRHAL